VFKTPASVSDGAVKKRYVKSPYSHSFLPSKKNRFLYGIFSKINFSADFAFFFSLAKFQDRGRKKRKRKMCPLLFYNTGVGFCAGSFKQSMGLGSEQK